MKLYFKFLFVNIFLLNIYATETNTTQANPVEQIFSIFGIDKQTQNQIIKTTKELSIEVLKDMKTHSIDGKNSIIENSVKTGINTIVDTKKIKIESFKIDNKTNKIDISLFLKGEDDILDIELNRFNWSTSEDKKYIIFEDIDIVLNIPWLDYIVQNIIKTNNGYIKVKNNIKLYSFLYSIKPSIKTKYKKDTKKDIFDIVNYPYDKKYIDIKSFKVKNNKIKADISLKGSKNFYIDIESFDLVRAKKKTIILLKNINIKRLNKPWILSILKYKEYEISLNYNDKLYKELSK
ncbi:MAG: hypothetical protein U9O56_06385 [Campylobacterota bacterium]|nr:hypothetical protein [Campylobacterota bacterium]